MNISYLFDFDGTLVDSMPVFASSMLRILDENNISYGADLVKIITPLGAHGTVQYFRNHLGLKMSEEQMMQVMGSYLMDAYCYTIPAKNHVIPVLKELKRRGASLNILTASPHITLDACLKRLEIWDLFDNIWSCDDFNTTKADPDIYVQAAGRMHTTVDKVLFLDDNLKADQTAKSAGMLTCGVYDDSSAAYVEEMKAANNFYIYDFMELLDLKVEEKA